MDLVEFEVVGGDESADDGFAEAEGGFDDDAVGVAGDGVDGEHDACGLGLDHALDGDGEVDVDVAPAVLLAVVHGAGFEEGGPAALDGLDHGLGADDVEEGGLLAGEGGVFEVFGGGGGADGDGAAAEFVVGLGDLEGHGAGHFGGFDGAAAFGGDEVERAAVVDVEGLDALGEGGFEAGVDEEAAVGGGGDDEAGRDGDAGAGHFAEVGALASGYGDIGAADVAEPDDRLGISGHSGSPRERGDDITALGRNPAAGAIRR